VRSIRRWLGGVSIGADDASDSAYLTVVFGRRTFSARCVRSILCSVRTPGRNFARMFEAVVRRTRGVWARGSGELGACMLKIVV
jgi:hypothetical protein